MGSASGRTAHGRYLRSSAGRLDVAPETFQHSKDKEEVVRLVVGIAAELGTTPAQVAIAWLRSRPGTVVPIVGASREEQLRDNLAAADVTIPPEQLDRLDAASAFSLGFPHELLRQRQVKEGTYGDQWALVDDRHSTAG
nr:aldo/keto reductase [Tenggerimyces flavus]